MDISVRIRIGVGFVSHQLLLAFNKGDVNKKTKFWRFIEIVPGAIAWLFLILPVVFSFISPSAVAIFVLIFDLYWLIRAFYMAWYLLLSYRRMKKALKTDYRAKIDGFVSADGISSDSLYHAVIFATFREEIDTLRPSVLSVVESDWESKRKIIVLAGEERDHERLTRVADELKREFADKIYDFLVFEHPDGIAGEVRGKGAGAAWAGKRFRKYILDRGIDDANVIVTIADADTRFNPQFFNCVSYQFLKEEDRHHRTYQPIPLYSNNIWHAPTISRLTAWGSSFWQMIEASRPWRLVNFATHCYSLKMVHEMGYWSVDVVNEDSRQFWNAYYAFSGNHKAVPIYLPVYLDAVLADSYFTTLKNQYLQKRRWAYGVEHLPFIVTQAIAHKEIPFKDRFLKIWRLMEGTISWSTASFYLMFVGWLPTIFSENFRQTVLAHNFPSFSRVILSAAWVAMMISVYISLSFLPKRPKGFHTIKYLEMIADWIVTPISAVVFGSIPALESQTRLMLGQYLTFWVTPKITKKDE